MKKFYIVGYDKAIQSMFTRNGWFEMVNPDKETLVVFTGGSDVSPELYGEAQHMTTYCDPDRDIEELWEFHCHLGNPKVGICRGGQFLNVASGGAMWQNVDNHAISGVHDLCDMETGEFIKVTSTHHQMMRPTNDAVWLAWAKESTKLEADNEVLMPNGMPDVAENIFGEEEDVWDCEVIFYDKTQSLCFQPHPEYGVKPCEDYFFKCLKKVFGKEVA